MYAPYSTPHAIYFAGVVIVVESPPAAPTSVLDSVPAPEPTATSKPRTADGGTWASLLIMHMGKQHEQNAQTTTTRALLCLSSSSREPQTRACDNRLSVVVMLFPLQRHGGGRYVAAAVPSKCKKYESNAQKAAARSRPHDAGADVETGTEVQEAEQEAVGVIIVLFPPLLCIVAGVACSAALRKPASGLRPHSTGAAPDFFSAKYRILHKPAEKSRLQK